VREVSPSLSALPALWWRSAARMIMAAAGVSATKTAAPWVLACGCFLLCLAGFPGEFSGTTGSVIHLHFKSPPPFRSACTSNLLHRFVPPALVLSIICSVSAAGAVVLCARR
jgi:hypothetical protein